MTVLLVLHVLSALVFFVAFGVEIPLLLAMRRATSAEELRRAIGGFSINTRIGPPALVTIIVTGFALAAIAWGAPPAWTLASFGALVVNAIVGGAVTGRIVIALRALLASADGPLAGDLLARARSIALLDSFAARVGLVGSIAVVMLLRPDLATTLAILLLPTLALVAITHMTLHRAA